MRFALFFCLALGPSQDGEIETLIRALGSDEPAERERAEDRLAALGEKARPAVLRALKHGDAEVANRARRVLLKFAPDVRMEDLFDAGFRRETAAAIPGFARRIWSTVPSEAASAVRDLAAHPQRENLAALAAVFGRAEVPWEVGQAYAELMEKSGSPELAPCVLPFLRHQNPAFRERALQALGRVKARECVPEILPLLEDPVSGEAALDTLEKLEVAPPGESVGRMLSSGAARVRHWGVVTVRKLRLKGFAAEIAAAALASQTQDLWEAMEALARSDPSWADLRPLLQVPEGIARLAALRLVLRLRLPEAFDAAVALLDDPYPEARAEAMNVVVSWGGAEAERRVAAREGPGSLVTLASLGAREARPRALKALGSANPAMRVAALSALRALDAHDESDRVAARLEDSDPGVRAEAARILPHLAGDRVGPRLAARFGKEEDPKVVAQLLEGVAETGCAEAAPHVLRFLKEGKGDVVHAAVRAAGSLRIKEAAPILVEGYVTGKPQPMPGAYEALLQIRPENLVDLLRPHLKPPKAGEGGPVIGRGRREDDPGVRAALYLLYVDPPGAKEIYLQCLKDGLVREDPEEMLRFLCAPEGLDWLVSDLEKGNHLRHSGSARLLAAYGRRDLADRAVKWVAGDRRDLSQIAVQLLGGLKAEEKVPDLAALLDGPSAEARDFAWSALLWVGGPKTVEIFRRRLGEGTPMNRAWAARFLGSAGDRDSIPGIEDLLNDKDPGVRVQAAYALYLLDSKSSFDLVLGAYRRGIGKDDWVWPSAFSALGGPKGRAIVRKMFESAKSEEERKNLLRAMSQGDDFGAEDRAFVESLLVDPDLATEAWELYLRVDPARAVARFSNARDRAAMPLGNWLSVDLKSVERSPATAGMTALLRDGDPNNRWLAAETLGEWGVREAGEPLARALHADAPASRRAAAIALLRLGDRRGLDEVMKLPRSTTLAQGRMSGALVALNFLRQPETMRDIGRIRWDYQGPLHWTLRDALEEFGRRSGLRLTISKSVPEHGLRCPLNWNTSPWTLEAILTHGEWGRFAAAVVEPGEIRIVTPDEAWRFWEGWAR